MPNTTGYYIESDFLNVQAPVLGQFFAEQRPSLLSAITLNNVYDHIMRNDDGEEVGYEELSPFIVSIVLNKALHFSLLLTAFASKYQTATGEEKNALKQQFSEAIKCARSFAVQDNYFLNAILNSSAHNLIMAERSPLAPTFWPLPPEVSSQSPADFHSFRL